MSSAVSAVTSGIASLNPFAKQKEDSDDKGEAIEVDSGESSGHVGRKSKTKKGDLRVSRALKSALVHEGVLEERGADLESQKPTPAVRELLSKSHIKVPSQVTDRSHGLSEYFISSSHNTYLMAHQLYGSSTAGAYEIALSTGSRCVEIDAWDDDDNADEPKVTHGFTLASNIPFRKVCETIRDLVDKEARETQKESEYHPAPIMISLENHCGAHGQKRMVEIMKEVLGDRLLSKRVRDEGTEEQYGVGKHVTLDELKSKVAIIVEYFFPNQEEEDDSSSSSEEEEEEEKQEVEAYKKQKEEAPKEGIIPELSELGVYAQSVKPRDKSWLEGELKDGPHDHLINVSESTLLSIMPDSSSKVGKHNAQHLMRVYPKGTRIASHNLHPVPFWGVGAQICALNWQTFDASMQLNEALFSGSDGYVLKPEALRVGGSGKLDTGKTKKLRLRVEGATDIPLEEGKEPKDIQPYVTCTLLHPDDLENEPPKKKTSAYKPHKLGILHKGTNPPPTNAIWNETLEWDYQENELTFLRILIKSDDRFASNPTLAVATVRLLYVVEGWSFIRMLDLKGRETQCTLLVKIDVEDA